MDDLPDIYCLGLKALGACRYDLSSPSLTFFSLGQLASVIALIFTFSQLVKPISKFRNATRFTPYWFPWIGIVAAIFLVIGAAVVRMFSPRDISLIGYPIVWEFVATICLMWASIVVIIRVSRKTHLSRHNAERYLHQSRLMIARGKPDDLCEYGDEIDSSISTAIKACKSHQDRAARKGTRGSESEPPAKFERICYTLLDLWADKQFAKILVTRCPQTATRILQEVQNIRLYDGGVHFLVRELIDKAITEPDSILHRENDYSGLGRVKQFTSVAFGNIDFVCSNLRPLQAWGWSSKVEATIEQLKCFGNAIDMALSSAIEDGRVGNFYAALSSALNGLNDIARSAAYAMSNTPESDISQSKWSTILSECADVHSNVIEKISTLPEAHQPKIEDVGIDPAVYRRQTDRTLVGAVAYHAYQYVEALAVCRRHDGIIRFNILDLWRKILGGNESTAPNALQAIRRRFVFALKEKITENLDVEHWYYPVIARTLMSMWGIPDSEGEIAALTGDYSDEEKDIYMHLYSLVKKNFAAIQRKNPGYATDLLPQKVQYDESPPSLQEAWFRGKVTTLMLDVSPTTTQRKRTRHRPTRRGVRSDHGFLY